MSDQYLGEIRMVGFNFNPVGWLLCQGQILSISQNAALFALLGTTYGGNGTSTFGLPNLQGRVAINQGSGPGGSYVMGQVGGAASVALTQSNLPAHTHPVNAVGTATNQVANPVGNFPCAVPALGGPQLNWSSGPASGTMAPTMIGNAGGSQPFSIAPPYQVVNFIIATTGIFPSRA